MLPRNKDELSHQNINHDIENGLKIMPGQMLKMVAVGILIILGYAGVCQAHFQANINGVRPAGMGGAFTGVADDANAFLFNPAGVVETDQIYLSGMYADVFSNLNASTPTGENDRLGYHLLSSGMLLDPDWGAIGISWTRFASLLYQENTFYATYGRTLLPDKKLAAGFNVKLLEWAVAVPASVQASEIVPYSEEKWGVTADLGVLYSLDPSWKAGVSLYNLIPARMGESTTNDIHLQVKAGTAYTLNFSRIEPFDCLTGSLDAAYRNEIWDLCVGAELWMLKRQVAFRAGLNMDEFSAGASYHPALSGVALGLQLDYAFTFSYQVESTWGTHRFGLTMAWDPKKTTSAEHKFTESRKIKNDTKHSERSRTETFEKKEIESEQIQTPATPVENEVLKEDTEKPETAVSQAKKTKRLEKPLKTKKTNPTETLKPLTNNDEDVEEEIRRLGGQ